jgi:integrase
MPKTFQRISTDYKGVFYIEGKSVVNRKPEKIFYIRYRKDGKMVEEKAGRQFADDMTAARASSLRGRRMYGDEISNQEKRAMAEAQKQAEFGKWTISKLWEAYKTNRPDLKGMVTDENRFHNHIKPSFGDKEPSELVPLDVDRLRLGLLKKKSPGTVKNILELLRRIVNFGAKKRICQGVNFIIEMPTVNNMKTEDLTPGQLQSLLAAIEKDDHPQAGKIMKLALFTGMRRMEIFKLKWDHVDFHKGVIEIKDPKSGTDERIPLNDAARELLQGISRTESPYIFPGRYGGPLSGIGQPANRIKAAAGLPKDFRPLHGLRHVYASMLASSGQVDLYTLQRLLTHKSPVMTQRYAHLRDETLKKASNLAGDIISLALGESPNIVDLPEKKN